MCPTLARLRAPERGNEAVNYRAVHLGPRRAKRKANARRAQRDNEGQRFMASRLGEGLGKPVPLQWK